MLQLFVHLHVLALRARARLRDDEGGQTTAEYALVLLGVATVALGIAAWAHGDKVGKLLDTVFDSLIKMVRS